MSRKELRHTIGELSENKKQDNKKKISYDSGHYEKTRCQTKNEPNAIELARNC